MFPSFYLFSPPGTLTDATLAISLMSEFLLTPKDIPKVERVVCVLFLPSLFFPLEGFLLFSWTIDSPPSLAIHPPSPRNWIRVLWRHGYCVARSGCDWLENRQPHWWVELASEPKDFGQKEQIILKTVFLIFRSGWSLARDPLRFTSDPLVSVKSLEVNMDKLRQNRSVGSGGVLFLPQDDSRIVPCSPRFKCLCCILSCFYFINSLSPPPLHEDRFASYVFVFVSSCFQV